MSSISAAVKSGTYSAYITWNAGTSTYNVQQNFVWSAMGAAAGSFIQLLVGETVEGNGYEINLGATTGWIGMFSVSATGMTKSDTSNYPIVRNLGILGGETGTSGGFIMRNSVKFFKIENCYSTGYIIGNASGGIAGGNSGIISGSIIITNCYSTGQIGNSVTGVESGGIVGASVSRDVGDSLITNCFSTGLIAGNSSGGIAGASAGNGIEAGVGTCRIIGCFSTGDMNGTSTGGITGANTASNNINAVVEISKCYSLGIINGLDAGGICGANAGSGGVLTINDCYSIGSIIGGSSGGIVGKSSANTAGTIASINNCYSVGSVSGTNAGGIAGAATGTGLTINSCVSNSPTRASGTATVNSSSTNMTILNGLPSGWSTSIWAVGIVVSVSSVSQNITLPILLIFQSAPFVTSSSSPNYYNRADKFSSLLYTLGPGNLPESPTNLVAIAGNAQVTISFIAGDDGGNAITNYKYSLTNGLSYTAFDIAVTSSPLTILGLINGVAYQIKLRAVNGIGDGAESESVIVTPITSVILYAGGEFNSAGQVSTNNIALWNGSTWSAIGHGLNSTCRTLLLGPDKSLYAGGEFTHAGTLSVNRISRWNEEQWKYVDTGANANIYALANLNDSIYIGGEFISSIAKYSPMTITGTFIDKGVTKTGLVLYNQFENIQIINYDNQWIVTARN